VRGGTVSAHYASILIGSAVAADATNLVPWFTMSNAWHSVSTNEVIRRASTGDAEAQCYLGKSYFEGLHGFPTNFAEGRQWLLKSAEQDVAQAQNTLGWNAANGIGMATNHAQAVYWYQKAADLGFAQSEMNLARTYRYGTGVPRDMSRALEWYRRSVDHGFRLAKRELGFILSDEPGFGPGERSEGVQLLREAANEGDATAQNRVGWSYWKGEGIKADESEAQRWFFAAARKGSIKAMDNLYALACEREDRVTLTNLFTIVADHAQRGVAPAQMLAGRMCSGGLGVAQDKREAMSWYEKAAAQGHAPAQAKLAALCGPTVVATMQPLQVRSGW